MLKWKQDSLKRYHEERAESEKLGNRLAEKDIAITELELRDIENNIAITELELAMLGLQPAPGQTGEQEGNSQTKGE